MRLNCIRKDVIQNFTFCFRYQLQIQESASDKDPFGIWETRQDITQCINVIINGGINSNYNIYIYKYLTNKKNTMRNSVVF